MRESNLGRAAGRSDYDRNRRDKEAKAFYNSAAWKKTRLFILSRDHHLCQQCLREKRLTPATLVHHIEPLEDAPELALDPDNLESVCQDCHNLMHPEKGFGFNLESKIIVVLGYPASGKTTWVEKNMKTYDMLLDLDRLIMAISNRPEHDRFGSAYHAVKVTNDIIRSTISNIRNKGYQFDRLYLIRTTLEEEEYFDLRTAGAKMYWLDVDRATCEQRLIEQGRRKVISSLDKGDAFLAEYERKLTRLDPDSVIT